MKNIERSIYIVIIIILVGVICCTTTYIFTTKNNKTNEINNNNETKDNENNKPQENEKITLTNEELAKYLSYVPVGDVEYKGAYERKNTLLNQIDEKLLLAPVFSGYSNDNSKEILVNRDVACEYPDLCPPEGFMTDNYIPLDYVKQELKKMYNYELKNLKNATSPNDIINIAGRAYYYENGNFVALYGGGPYGAHISYMDSYEAVDNKLVIYEYAAYFDMKNKLKDYYTSKIKDLSGWYGNTTFEEDKSIVSVYLGNHKEEYTKYKHTFKKNNTGYYWYSTEAV